MKKKEYRVSDFEWASVGHFYRHVEVSAVLLEFSTQQIHSFHIPPTTGIKGLVNQKARVLGKLRENLSRITAWVEQMDHKLSPQELALVRSLYQSTGTLAKTVEKQIIRAKSLLAWEQAQLDFDTAETEVKNELPF